MAVERENAWASFGGTQALYSHDSRETGTQMRFSVYTPPQAADGPCPVLVWLSGLTCTWENFTVKAGAQAHAARHGMIVVAPDTSPRGADVPDEDRYDFGTGAGFYVDATEEPWSRNYRMYSYITAELTKVIAETVPAADMNRLGIFGHSMGGHGALTLAMRNPDLYRSVSAFAPIVAPTQVPWGRAALTGYLGPDETAWQAHDATALMRDRGWNGDILIDQGDADEFLSKELRPELFESACEEKGVSLTLRLQPGYDHSYYFIATFMADHIGWHADRLKG